MHDFDSPRDKRRGDGRGSIITMRGLANLGSLLLLMLALVMLFAGYPIIANTLHRSGGDLGAFGLGGTNASGQVPSMLGLPSLIDPDTPQSARTRMSLDGTKRMNLVFSDEFNKDGRSFVSSKVSQTISSLLDRSIADSLIL